MLLITGGEHGKYFQRNNPKSINCLLFNECAMNNLVILVNSIYKPLFCIAQIAISPLALLTQDGHTNVINGCT